MDDDMLLGANFAYFTSIHLSFISYHCEDSLVIEYYCPNRFSGQFDFYKDVPAHLDVDNLSDLETMLRYVSRDGTGSQVLFHRRCNLLEKNTTHAFREWWSKMSISLDLQSTCQ